MIATVDGIIGAQLIAPVSRMAQGRNSLHELNHAWGEFIHPDGWGAVYRIGSQLNVIRSPLPFWSDPVTATLRNRTVILIHARKASVGAVTTANTHPFVATRSGETFYFCHNGTIRDPAIAVYPGDTDSVRYFHYLLDRYDAYDPEASLSRAVTALSDYTAANAFLLTSSQLCIINCYNKYPRYYTMYRAGPVFSSEPLPEIAADWTPIENGTVMCVAR